ncbi:MAG: MBL fold metallo-hydrolase [Patescibacteria group bacterium]|jgi:competence protein ComEC
MSHRVKLLIIFSGAAAILGAVFLFGIFYHPPKKLEADFLDVGQGDAILIKAPDGQNILIDGGPNSRLVERLSDVMPPWDKQIDLMILSHPHDDHVL